MIRKTIKHAGKYTLVKDIGTKILQHKSVSKQYLALKYIQYGRCGS